MDDETFYPVVTCFTDSDYYFGARRRTKGKIGVPTREVCVLGGGGDDNYSPVYIPVVP